MAKALSRKPGATEDRLFELRLARSADDLWGMLEKLYGRRRDYPAVRRDLEAVLREAWAERSVELKWLDLERDLNPDWFQRPGMAGYVFYADRFAGDLKGVRQRLDYLADLGITYIHIMPCLTPRPGDSDGGYSVMDYTRIDRRLGTMADFERLCADARARGMSVCIDMVLNHTAKEHAWAEAARAGVREFEDFYLTFESEDLPRQYEESLLEVFPENAPGNFTFYPDWGRWVWTTFNEHQWDLDWSNPRVFLEMTRIMLFLANRGVDVLRLDAVAFMWKRMGTKCQSEPEVHMLLHALRAATRIAAPAAIHLEEAIVGPEEMLPYLGRGEHDGKEGNLAYHNSLMVQFWSALAARDTSLMTHVLGTHFPDRLTNATYATYIRCHDDIGWAVTDEDAAAVGLSGPAHRAFLSEFYEAPFRAASRAARCSRSTPGPATAASPGRRPRSQGWAARSRTGTRQAFGSPSSASCSVTPSSPRGGGIPLVYMGDELAILNDWSYLAQPDIAHDSRWLHRPRMDWDRVERARLGQGPEGLVYEGTKHILARRRATPELHAAVPVRVPEAPGRGLFALLRDAPTGPMLCLYNFTEEWTGAPGSWATGAGGGGASRRPVGCAGDTHGRRYRATALCPSLASLKPGARPRWRDLSI